jgi:hypothetical protein
MLNLRIVVKTIIFCGILAAIFAILLSRGAAAQENRLDLSLSPVFFEFSVEPGAVIKDKIRVRNNTANSLDLAVGIQRIAPGRNSEVEISDPRREDEYVSWISFERKSVTARPREWTDIPFTINVPDNAAFGYYFAFFLSQAGVEEEPGAARVVGGVAVPVLLNVKAPGAQISGNLIEFKAGSFINEYLPVEFTARVENTGNVHIKPRGNIFIRRGDRDISILEINEDLGSVLPGAQRTFESAWTDGFLVRDPDTKKLQINWNKLTEFRFGPYSAHLLMVYDDGQKDVALEESVTFWVIPYKVIGGIILALIVLMFIGKKLLAAYVASEIRKRQK